MYLWEKLNNYMKTKKSNSARFRHLPEFKGILHFTGINDCVIYYNDNIVGFGSILKSTGKQFRCLWNSPEQMKFASALTERMGRFGVRGYQQGDYIYITSLYQPPNRSTQARKLHQSREIADHEQNVRENNNQIFTGYHSSNNTHIPAALKNINVKLTKKETKMDDIDMLPIKKRKHEKREKDDFELANLQEKRIAESESFYTVRKHLDSVTLKLELIKMKFSVRDIEAARDLINVACQYMSYRAK